MAPKRRARKVVGMVTKKVVKKTVEVSIVETGTTNEDDDDTERAVGDSQETVELLDSLSPPYDGIPTEEHIKRTIIVEETKFPPSEDDEARQVPVDQEQTADDVGGQKRVTRRSEKEKETRKAAKAEEPPPTDTTDDDDETQEPEKEKSPEPEQAVPEKMNKNKKVKEGGDGGVTRPRKRRRKAEVGNEEYKRYVFRVLKQVHPGMKVSSQAMEVLNAYMNDMFGRLADEAAKLSRYTKKMTLSSREIQGAVRLVLPGELGKHAVAEGAKAVTNYMDYDGSNGGK